METPTHTAPPVALDRLVRLVESAIRSQDGKMILDIRVDNDLLEQIRLIIQKDIERGNGDKFAVESALRIVFAWHETHMTQAATDDANMGLRRAMESLPNDQREGPPTKDSTEANK